VEESENSPESPHLGEIKRMHSVYQALLRFSRAPVTRLEAISTKAMKCWNGVGAFTYSIPTLSPSGERLGISLVAMIHFASSECQTWGAIPF